MGPHTSLNILIGGAAGQGMATIGHALGKSLVRKGHHLHVTQTIQSRIRGGYNTFALRVADVPVAAPADAIDILLALSAEGLDFHKDELAPQHLILADAKLGVQAAGLLGIPLADLAHGGHANTAMLGVIGCLLGIGREELAASLHDTLGAKKNAGKAKSEDTLEKAYAWAESNSLSAPPLPDPVLPPLKRLFMSGHEAVALGAMSAGLKFCSFYPISPATSLPQAIASAADAMGIIVEQGEDELAVINMALGASFAGAPALVATSGAGLSLMAEGISLAGVSETPVVLVIGMRPGPATGLATRTEQADLDLAVSVGHGEFPRAVFAPASLEDCFQLTRHALIVAERFQGPVFVLTDQYLADSYRDVEPFYLEEGLPGVPLPGPSDDTSYERYAFADNGVSPRLLPGAGKALVCLNSYEHTADGHLTEDLPLRERMNGKRLSKAAGLCSEVIPPLCSGPDAPELLLVSWGSSLGAVTEAAGFLTESGTPTKVCHFTQVYPLRPEQFLHHFLSAKRVISVESNATGQLARLIRCHSSFSMHAHIGRWDGLPLTRDYILDKLSALRA